MEVQTQAAFEILDEFDEAADMTVCYCNQLSGKEFESQAIKETEKELQKLMSFLDKNHSSYEKVLKKRKKDDMENSGVLSFLKVKVMSALGLENYLSCDVTADEVVKKLDVLKAGMCKTFNYAQGAKRRRFSKRLAANQKQKVNDENKRPGSMSTSTNRSCIPPPPLPPLAPILWPLINDQSAPVQPSTPLKDKNVQKKTPSSAAAKKNQSRRKLAAVTVSNTNNSVLSIHDEIVSGNPLQHLKSTPHPRSPGGTPQRKKCFLRLSSSSTDNDSRDPVQRALSAFLEEKFRNVKTPSPPTSFDQAWSPSMMND